MSGRPTLPTSRSGKGFCLVAIIDWASRAVLAWRLSNTMDVTFCLAALEEALARSGQGRVELAGFEHRPLFSAADQRAAKVTADGNYQGQISAMAIPLSPATA